MTTFPDDLRYSQDHIWVRVNAGTATIGITDYAQRQLCEIVLVELASIGELVHRSLRRLMSGYSSCTPTIFS